MEIQKVEAVEVNKMKLGEPDSSGRRRPVIEIGSEYKIKADLVIKSLGFDPERIYQNYLMLKNLLFLNGEQLKLI